MNIENRLKLFELEKAKILGFGRSHLRSVEGARRLLNDVEKKVKKSRRDFSSQGTFQYWIWETVAEHCDNLLRREHFQFRVFDDGAIDFLDQNLIRRPGGDINEDLKQMRDIIACLPEKARAVLQLHYQRALSCRTISKRILEPVDEVYQLWQHSMIFLWETTHRGDYDDGFREKDDETFWTLALRYLDGTASEKFVSELNSEIHLSKSKTKEYNDLRFIDGVMIEFGTTDLWPPCSLVNPKNLQKPSKKEVKEDRENRRGVPVLNQKTFASLPNFFTSLLPKTKAEPKKRAIPETEPTLPPPPCPPAGINESEVPDPAPPKTQPAEAPKAVLASENMDQSTRHGVHFDNTPFHKKWFKLKSVWMKRTGILGLVIVSVFFLAFVGRQIHISPFLNTPDSSRDHLLMGSISIPSAAILQSVNLEFDPHSAASIEELVLNHGDIEMTKGTMRIHTNNSVGVIIEAPARFSIPDDETFILREGRFVFSTSSIKKSDLRIKTNQFHFNTSEGEIGFLCDQDATDLLVFTGQGYVENLKRKVGPGEGLRFRGEDYPEELIARDEAHRLPETIPVCSPKAYGANLIVNHSFELGCLSRSCKTERLYRDIPLGWKAGWQRDGVWTAPMEQHSGTVRLTDAIGGLPTPVDGERYLWINHGFVTQEVRNLEPGGHYELSVRIASHRNLGPGAGHLVRHVGGNTFRFGVWTGNEWIAEASGQLKSGQPFQEMKVQFTFPELGLPGMSPVVMLTGETRIFYDSIVLKKIN